MGLSTSTPGADGPLNNEGSAPDNSAVQAVPAVTVPPQAQGASPPMAPLPSSSDPSAAAGGSRPGLQFPEPARPDTGQQALIFAMTETIMGSDERTDRAVKLMNAFTKNAMKIIGLVALVIIGLGLVIAVLVLALHVPQSGAYTAGGLGVVGIGGGVALKARAIFNRYRLPLKVDEPIAQASAAAPAGNPPQPPSEPPPMRTASIGDVDVPPPRTEGQAAS